VQGSRGSRYRADPLEPGQRGALEMAAAAAFESTCLNGNCGSVLRPSPSGSCLLCSVCAPFYTERPEPEPVGPGPAVRRPTRTVTPQATVTAAAPSSSAGPCRCRRRRHRSRRSRRRRRRWPPAAGAGFTPPARPPPAGACRPARAPLSSSSPQSSESAAAAALAPLLFLPAPRRVGPSAGALLTLALSQEGVSEKRIA
jgi:hypothetical protein